VVGVDVSERRGLDVVVLDDDGQVAEAHCRLDADQLGAVLRRWHPAAVAIDSPPGSGLDPDAAARECEQQLRRLGIQIFSTPSDGLKFAGAFYNWIRVGMQAFDAAAAAGYPRLIDPAVVRGHALEVFPHASDVFLRGLLPPSGTTKRIAHKRAWRLATLESAGVRPDGLCANRFNQPTMDSIDAALAALTARRAVEGMFSAWGKAGEWIVVPVAATIRFARQPIDR